MKLPRPNISFKWKINLLIYLGIVILLLNFPIVYLEINHINDRIFDLELSEDLYNSILDMRRYEKNYLLYQNKDGLESTLYYINVAKSLATKKIIKNDRSASKWLRITEHLKTYESFFIDISAKISLHKIPDKDTQTKIRSIGKNMVNFAENLLNTERQRIAKAMKNALWWPLIFMGAMFFLFLASATMVTQKVTKPLAKIEKATEKIARGDFSLINRADGMENQVDHLVTAFNKMVRELEARQEQIIHSRKIASLGTLVSGTAHELNNPINNIILTIDTLVGGRKISEERRSELLNDILKQALRASVIVKNLLDFSRAETAAFVILDIGELLRETLTITKNQIMVSRVQLCEEIAMNLPPINGNRQGLQQVLLNVITNAVQAMPNGGDLTVRAFEAEYNKIKVQVADTGVGIPKKQIPNIFDPFFTTKDVGQGTGLGLSVSYGIIKKHGGQIWVDSTEGKGTTFTFTLPFFEQKNHE